MRTRSSGKWKKRARAPMSAAARLRKNNSQCAEVSVKAGGVALSLPVFYDAYRRGTMRLILSGMCCRGWMVCWLGGL